MIKHWLTALAICISSMVVAAPLENRSLDKQDVRELMVELGSSYEADIIEETQSKWLRPKGKERWEILEISKEQKQFVLDWAQAQGLYSSWEPTSNHYDKALILGATTGHMTMRLNYLKELWNKGVRFDEVVWLTGDRPLDKNIDDLRDVAANESQAAPIIWESADLPQEMKSLPVRFIATPMKNKQGVLTRPNTMDTLVTWLETTDPCKALFVSSQPFCGYQFAIINTALPETFTFDVVGSGADPSSHPAAAAITLDSIARWLYQENLCL